MAKHIYTLGLSEIKTGAVGCQDSALGSDGYTYQDTCQMVTNDPTVTDFFAEEVDDPVVSIERAGTIQFNWSIMDPSPDILVKYIGGTASSSAGQAENDQWEPPTAAQVIEKRVVLIPQQGLKFDVARMRIRAKLNGNFSKSALLLLEVQGTVLIPETEGVAKLKASIVSAETPASNS